MLSPVLNCQPFGCRPAVLALLCALSVSAAADSTIYRWKGADGRIHYGDATSAPQGAQAVPRRFDSAGIGGTPAAPVERPVSDMSTSVQRCEQAKAQHDAYLNADQIVETDSLGVERTIEGTQREQLLARAEMDVSRACDDPSVSP